MFRLPFGLAALCFALPVLAADAGDDRFRQLEQLLPTPNAVRNAAGAPGHAYWQQRADYTIRATLDEDKRSISGSETITYHNNAPDTLRYLWLQLDQNKFKPDSDAVTTHTIESREAWAKAKSDEDGLHFEGMRTLAESR